MRRGALDSRAARGRARRCRARRAAHWGARRGAPDHAGLRPDRHGGTACCPGRTTTSPAGVDRHRPAAGLTPARCRATRTACRSSRPTTTARTASAPGRASCVKVPGLDTPAAFAKTGAVPVTDLARAYDRRAADRRDQRPHGQAPPHLGRARLERATARRPPRLLIHPGMNWREGAALHRRAAEPEGRRRQAARARPRLQALPRPGAHRLEAVRAAPLAHGVDLPARSGKAGSIATTSTWRGTSRSERQARSSQRMLSIRDRAFAELGDHNLRDLKVEGVVAQVHASTRSSSPRPPQDPNVFRRVEGNGHGPLLPERGRLPVGIALRPRPGRPPARIPGNTYEARFICNIPRSASPDDAGAPVALRARPLRRRRRGGRAQRGGARATRTTCSSARPTGSAWPTRTWCQRARGPAQTCRASRPSPTASSRASSTSCSSGRTMIHPAGFASNPAFQQERPPADRHPPALLLRQQPGRDRGRRAHRGGARLQPLGALRGRDELQPAAQPQRGLRRLRADPLPVLPEPAGAPARAAR